LRYVLDDIKAKNEERRKKKENKVKKYTDEIHQKKVKTPTPYSSIDPSKNLAYGVGSLKYAPGSQNSYNYSRISSARNLEYGNPAASKSINYGVIPSKSFNYKTGSPNKSSAYGVIKTPNYGTPVKTFSPSANQYIPKSSIEALASSGPDYYNK